MKSGTAQKMVLNTISTGVMVRLGRVYSNLMIDMPATNEKLRGRAVKMIELAARVTRPMAVQAIGSTGGSQPHNNFQPYLCVDFIISLFGIFPSQT